jgi:hypothetical protein
MERRDYCIKGTYCIGKSDPGLNSAINEEIQQKITNQGIILHKVPELSTTL